MNKTKAMRKMLSILLVIAIFAGVMLLSGCRKASLVIKDSDTCIVIKVTEEAMGGEKTEMLLINYMQTLKDKGELEFEIANGKITSINGIENPADYSSCWMLYTSDETMSNAAWGTVEYDGKQYGSAVSGAGQLEIKPGYLYIWVYQAF